MEFGVREFLAVFWLGWNHRLGWLLGSRGFLRGMPVEVIILIVRLVTTRAHKSQY